MDDIGQICLGRISELVCVDQKRDLISLCGYQSRSQLQRAPVLVTSDLKYPAPGLS